MEKGIIAKYSDGELVVNCTEGKYVRTQQGLKLLPSYIERFDLKEGDKVYYSSTGLYQCIRINSKIKA